MDEEILDDWPLDDHQWQVCWHDEGGAELLRLLASDERMNQVWEAMSRISDVDVANFLQEVVLAKAQHERTRERIKELNRYIESANDCRPLIKKLIGSLRSAASYREPIRAGVEQWQPARELVEADRLEQLDRYIDAYIGEATEQRDELVAFRRKVMGTNSELFESLSDAMRRMLGKPRDGLVA